MTRRPNVILFAPLSIVAVVFVCSLSLMSCNQDSCVSSVAPGELAITDLRQNPLVWRSEKVYEQYSDSDSLATIHFPRRLLDTTDFDDIVLSYELYGWPDCDVVNPATNKGYRVECPSRFDIWWGGRSEISLFGFAANPASVFLGSDRTLRLRSSQNPRAWAELVRYSPGYQPLLLNKVGRDESSWYSEGMIELSPDSDGVWFGWYADWDRSGCDLPAGNELTDTLVKLDEFGNRIDAITLSGVEMRDFCVHAGRFWVLTLSPEQRIVEVHDGIVVGDYALSGSEYDYVSLLFARDTLWLAKPHPSDRRWGLMLTKFDFTSTVPMSLPATLDSMFVPDVSVGPTWDGAAFVYWTYGRSGQIIRRCDTEGRVMESAPSFLYLSGEVCGAIGSYWVTHQGVRGAPNRGISISRVCF